MLTQMKSKQHSSGDLVELRKSSEEISSFILREQRDLAIGVNK